LTLQQGTRSPQYLQTIIDLLRGSNLRGQDEVARDLAERILPADLVDIVESGDAKRLADALGRDLGQMTRLVGHLVDNARLYTIEGHAAPDVLEITMMDGGQAKPISQLSKGQMATALLPLILRPAPYPLVFDQPEDDLDNRFVFETLVERVRQLKTERQLIFVTHNANIPVLGEADRVIVMSMDGPNKAAPPAAGGVDEVKDAIIGILEGGVDAFNRRQRRYGSALVRGIERP
jgi:ATPase subunit of ABC transporter with duplicated ATPase domains